MAGFFDVRGVKIPVAVSAFPDEIYAAPRSWAERAYPKLMHYNKLDKGGHFAAWEQPELFTAEMRTRRSNRCARPRRQIGGARAASSVAARLALQDKVMTGTSSLLGGRLLAVGAAALCVIFLSWRPSDAAEDNEVRPFEVHVPEAALIDLRKRIHETRWPDKETVEDQSQGAPLAQLKSLLEYWGDGYNWRKVEAKLNSLPQFATKIDGLDIHFIHVRSKHPNALAMIVTHGWPGSVIEQFKIIDPLADPTAHGGSASDAFDVVVPSLPGYGFSGKPTAPGWTPVTIAQRLGEIDATPRLYALCRAGRRLGQRRLGGNGPAAAPRLARHSHQHAGHGSSRHLESHRVPPGAARRAYRRRAQCVGSTGRLLQ